MKLVIVFEVPDNQADAYAGVAARMIQHHAFAVQQGIKHWSFDQEMRPIAGVLAGEGFDLSAAVRLAVAAEDMAALHSEALREDWARNQVAAAGKNWATHMAKFDGTVLER